jgi:hypothetical protein
MPHFALDKTRNRQGLDFCGRGETRLNLANLVPGDGES